MLQHFRELARNHSRELALCNRARTRSCVHQHTRTHTHISSFTHSLLSCIHPNACTEHSHRPPVSGPSAYCRSQLTDPTKMSGIQRRHPPLMDDAKKTERVMSPQTRRRHREKIEKSNRKTLVSLTFLLVSFLATGEGHDGIPICGRVHV